MIEATCDAGAVLTDVATPPPHQLQHLNVRGNIKVNCKKYIQNYGEIINFFEEIHRKMKKYQIKLSDVTTPPHQLQYLKSDVRGNIKVNYKKYLEER